MHKLPCTFLGKIKTFVTFVSLVFFCAQFSFAEKMDYTLQEAIYLFELKGETAEAVKLLEKVSRDGDEADKEKAFFYLGKIQELAGAKDKANYFYNQSLNRSSEISKSYWLSEREAATSLEAENLLRKTISLKSPLKKTYGSSPTYLLLQDGSVKKIVSDSLVSVPVKLSPSTKVFHIDNQGVWQQPANDDSLYFTSLQPSTPSRSYAIADINSFYKYDDYAIIQKNKQLYLLNKKNEVVRIPDNFNDCSIEGFYEATQDFILNCPDNALHFVSHESITETKVIAQFDVVQKTLVSKKHLFVVSGNNLYCYNPKQSTKIIWKSSVNNIEHLFVFNNTLATLEASGKVTLFDMQTGVIRASVRSDASSMYPLAQGSLGLFSSEGTIIAVDTLLKPLWHFNFTTPIEQAPIYTDGNIYLNFGDKKLQGLSPRYYGKKLLQSELLARKAAIQSEKEQWAELSSTLDTLFKLEPGNAEGWFFKALYLEKQNASEKERQKAWSEAVRLSASTPQTTRLILNRYSKVIGAKFVGLLPISPKTRYPQFFSSKKNLYTIDPAADKLFCINAENGDLRWSKNIGKLDKSPVIANDENSLAIASGYNLSLYDLVKETAPANVQLPGKAFAIEIFNDAIFVSTWNGFLIKISRQDHKPIWSRKVFALPFLITQTSSSIIICNLEGEIVELDENEGMIKEGSAKRVQGSVSHIQSTDSLLVAAVNGNKMTMFSLAQKDKAPIQIITESPIASLQKITVQGESQFLLGLADQSILLYSSLGTPLWKFQGRGSIFTKPFVKDEEAWIDQGNVVIAIDLKTGKESRRFNAPGGAGTPFIMNHTLYSASPKRLLYGYSL